MMHNRILTLLLAACCCSAAGCLPDRDYTFIEGSDEATAKTLVMGLTVDASAATQLLTVNHTPGTLVAYCNTEDGGEWITLQSNVLSESETEVRLTTTANTGNESRTARVSLSPGTALRQFAFIQQPLEQTGDEPTE